MLVVSPTKVRPTTATTPTPIGCKLLKINRLNQQLSLPGRFEKVRILQSKKHPSTVSAKFFLNNCDTGKFSLAHLCHHGCAHGHRHAFVGNAFSVKPDPATGNLAYGIGSTAHQSCLLE
jgi:hypothetical protein